MSEAAREGLTLLAERLASLEALREAVDEGEASGPSTPFGLAAFLEEERRWRSRSA